jgi:ABC-2 type transport system permease protein
MWAVVRREFLEIVRTRLFIISTLLGPAFLLALLLVPTLVMDDDAGTSRIAIIDQTPDGIGITVDAMLTGSGEETRDRFTKVEFQVETFRIGLSGLDDLQSQLRERVGSEDLDGYLWLPRDLVEGDTARYEGSNATNQGQMRAIRLAVRDAVQRERFDRAGIDRETVYKALGGVAFEARKSGSGAVTGSPLPALVFAILVTLGGWFTIINSSNSVIRAVREERRDKVVEIVLSSIRSRTLLFGKIIGIWGASLLQASIWIAIGSLTVLLGGSFIEQLGGNPEWIPQVPVSVPAVLFVFLAGGYFFYAGLAAALTAVSLSDQEASQIPSLIQWLPLPAWILIGKVLNDPNGTLPVVGSFVPFLAPIVVPTRVALAQIPALQLIASALVLYGCGWLCIVLAAKLYRVTIMATGKKATPRQLLQWLKSA